MLVLVWNTWSLPVNHMPAPASGLFLVTPKLSSFAWPSPRMDQAGICSWDKAICWVLLAYKKPTYHPFWVFFFLPPNRKQNPRINNEISVPCFCLQESSHASGKPQAGTWVPTRQLTHLVAVWPWADALTLRALVSSVKSPR